MKAENTDYTDEQKKTDEKYMCQAIVQARKAFKLDETPIGCVIVHDGKVIGRGYKQKTWRLASGRMHFVCNTGTVSDVRGSDRAVTDPEGGGGMYESKSRMRRIGSESA